MHKITDKAAQEEMNWVVALISSIRSVRADMNVPAAAKIKMLLKVQTRLTRNA